MQTSTIAWAYVSSFDVGFPPSTLGREMWAYVPRFSFLKVLGGNLVF